MRFWGGNPWCYSHMTYDLNQVNEYWQGFRWKKGLCGNDELNSPNLSFCGFCRNIEKDIRYDRYASPSPIKICQLWVKKGYFIWSNYSDLTRPHPKWWLSKGHLLFQENLGWWNIIIWPDFIDSLVLFGEFLFRSCWIYQGFHASYQLQDGHSAAWQDNLLLTLALLELQRPSHWKNPQVIPSLKLT